MADKETLSGMMFVMEIKFSAVLSLLDRLEAIFDRQQQCVFMVSEAG